MNNTSTIPSRRRWMNWVMGVAFWIAIALVFSVQTYIVRTGSNPDFGWLDAFRVTMPQWLVWGALSPAIVWADRRLGLSGAPIPRRFGAHVLLGTVFTLTYTVLKWAADSLLYEEIVGRSLAFVVSSFQWNILFYWMIAGVYIAFDYYVDAREKQLRTLELEKSLADARLEALTAQLHPHFLFNTLNAISGLMEEDPKTARDMIAHLGDLLRFSLDHAEAQHVTLGEELAFLNHYLAIEKIRFQDRLTVHCDVDAGLMEAMVPSLLLQPLVENAVRHGITPRAAGGNIYVAVHANADRVSIEIADDGVGLPNGWSISDSLGVGLSNTTARLTQLYPRQHRIEVSARDEGGTIVEIEIPLRLETTEVGESK